MMDTLLTDTTELMPITLPPAGNGHSSLLGDLFDDVRDIDTQEDIEHEQE
jgi:hypothetical protein